MTEARQIIVDRLWQIPRGPHLLYRLAAGALGNNESLKSQRPAKQGEVDKSVREAAAITGVSENTVKSRMYLGRRKLAAMLSAENLENESVPLVPDVNPSQRVCAEEVA